jgi:hypothetical protein
MAGISAREWRHVIIKCPSFPALTFENPPHAGQPSRARNAYFRPVRWWVACDDSVLRSLLYKVPVACIQVGHHVDGAPRANIKHFYLHHHHLHDDQLQLQ